ncbi:hypothetical protein NDU88_006563 [Pleurodeles waltl]|uniref:Uncharacterized protein n=1 Tax=Pleurodeles waltl TaxID=8319 RepID=A0AAV7TXZ8_PLEWA|nr:hypothetical protein NDU88_006563 [Pleurodeles waltl]
MLLVPVAGPTKGQPATTPGPRKDPRSGTSRRGPKSPAVWLIRLLPEIREGPQLFGLLEDLRTPTLCRCLKLLPCRPSRSRAIYGASGTNAMCSSLFCVTPPLPYLCGPTSAADSLKDQDRARSGPMGSLPSVWRQLPRPLPAAAPAALRRGLGPNRLIGPPSQWCLQAPCRSPGHTREASLPPSSAGAAPAEGAPGRAEAGEDPGGGGRIYMSAHAPPS